MPNKDQIEAAGPISAQNLEQMESTLANDESSSDEELISFFCEDCGIPEAQARLAVSYREAIQAMVIPEEGVLARLMATDAVGG